MSHLRAVTRIISLLLYTAASYASIRAGIVRHRLTGSDRLRYFCSRYQGWCRGVARIMGMRVRIVGRVPAAPYLLVTNHVSYTDIIALGATAAPIFVAKSEIARWPALGFLVREAGTVFLDRERIRHLPRVIEQVEQLCSSGLGLALFPEGTTGDGRSVQRFRPSLLEVAARSGLGVTPAALVYRTAPGCRPASERIAWVGSATLIGHIYPLLRLPWFEAQLVFGDRQVQGEDRKQLAETLQAEVARLLTEGSEPGAGREGEDIP
jgi:1-acyl-sn-glycerol-3-phosphate acyltransferase